LPSFMHPTASRRYVIQIQHVDHIYHVTASDHQRWPENRASGYVRRRTKVDDIKNFAGTVFCKTCKDLSIRTGRHTDDRREMGMVMLDKFDPDFLLLPQLQTPIDRGCNNKIRSGELLSHGRPRHKGKRVAHRVTVTKLRGSLCIKLL